MSTMIKNHDVKFEDGSKYTVSIEKYSSAEEVVKDLETRKNHCYRDMKEEDLDEWNGVESFDEAMDLLKHGYQPTVDRLQGMLKFNKKGSGKRISFSNNVHGFAPVVPLALKGVPNSMIDMKMKPIKCKVIDVYYDLDALAFVSSDKIIECGQKLLETVIELEKQGYRFNLYALQVYAGDKDADALCVKIKSSDKPFDLKRMSYPLTHTSFLRVVGFDWQGKSPVTKFRGPGRGSNLKIKLSSESKRQKLVKDLFGDNAVYIALSGINEKNGEDYIKEVLVK